MIPDSTPKRAWLPAVLVCFVLFGLFFLALSSLPMDLCQAAARFTGIALLVLAGLLCLARRWVERWAAEMGASFSSFFSTLWRSLREAWRGDGRVYRYGFLVIMVAAVALRLFFLFQPLRSDEAVTLTRYASRPLWVGLSRYYPNNHLLHTFQVHIAYLIFGYAPWALRLPAFVAGLLVVPAAYVATRLLSNKYAALLTAALVATSSVLIEFSTLARGYTLQCLFFLLILALSASLMRHREPAGWLMFSIASALGFYTMPTMLFPFGAVVVWLVLSAIMRLTEVERGRFIKDLIIAVLLVGLFTGILYAPVFAGTGWRSVVANKRVLPLEYEWPEFARRLGRSLTQAWGQWNRDVPMVVNVLLVAGLVVSVACRGRDAARRRLLVLIALLWCGLVLFKQRFVPSPRSWLPFLPLYLGLAASGLAHLLGGLQARLRFRGSLAYTVLALAMTVWLGVTALVTCSVYYSSETGSLRDAERITGFLKGYLRSDDMVLARRPSNALLEYYFSVYGMSPRRVARGHLKADVGGRLVVVVNTSASQTLAELLERAELTGLDPGEAAVLREYESATLYELAGPVNVEDDRDP